MSARHHDEEEGGGFRVPGLILAFVGLLGIIALLIWFGPQVEPAEAAPDEPGAETEGEPGYEPPVDPFADVPDEPPPKPRNRGPLADLPVITEAPAWVAAIDHVEAAGPRVESAYEVLERQGAAAVKSEGYAARLGYLKALEGTEELVPWLEKIEAENADAKEMLRRRKQWQKKVDEIDRDFELIPRD